MTSQSSDNEKKERRILLIGLTGMGKSATGNTILGEKDYFRSGPYGKSLSKKCKIGSREFQEYNLVVCDTPGYLGTGYTEQELIEELTRLYAMLSPGPHIILFVIEIKRTTDTDVDQMRKILNFFRTLLGNDIEKFTYLTFTRLDEIEKDKSTELEFISSLPKSIKKLFVDKVDLKFLFVNNILEDENKKTEQVEKILRAINKLYEENSFCVFKNKEMISLEKINLDKVQGNSDEEKRKEIREAYNTGKEWTNNAIKEFKKSVLHRPFLVSTFSVFASVLSFGFFAPVAAGGTVGACLVAAVAYYKSNKYA